MKILVKNITENPASLLRKAGYVFQRQEQAEQSFVRVFGQSGYPRFHCYTHVSGLDLMISLHLDQKKHTYGNETRHHGEYENTGPVQEEVERLLKIFHGNAQVV
ncbi:MAG: hypothetical protein KBD27_00925 [Candidatus Moranbacteria bacterium]|nr:hypothetical protein [Candidatus Moranbacteria bacterium]